MKRKIIGDDVTLSCDEDLSEGGYSSADEDVAHLIANFEELLKKSSVVDESLAGLSKTLEAVFTQTELVLSLFMKQSSLLQSLTHSITSITSSLGIISSTPTQLVPATNLRASTNWLPDTTHTKSMAPSSHGM